MLLNLECDQAYNHGFGVEEDKGRWNRGTTCSWRQLRGGCVECPAVDELVSDTPLKERGNQLTEYRYGDDGSWSAISIRVGSPQQWVDVMASTVSSETWVVGAAGCQSGSKFLWFRLFLHRFRSTWRALHLHFTDSNTFVLDGFYTFYLTPHKYI